MNIRVLIIEDQILIAENLKEALLDMGYTIAAVCYSYKAALKAIEDKNYDIVIIDINLSNDTTQSGLQLAEILAKQNNCPFIFLTAYSDKNTITHASNLSPSAYLVKPVNEQTLFSTIQLAIHNYQNTKTNIEINKLQENFPFFYAKNKGENIKILWNDVAVIKSVKNNIELLNVADKQTYKIRTSINKCLETLIPQDLHPTFKRVNRSSLVNNRYITSFTKDIVITPFGKFEITNNDLILNDI